MAKVKIHPVLMMLFCLLPALTAGFLSGGMSVAHAEEVSLAGTSATNSADVEGTGQGWAEGTISSGPRLGLVKVNASVVRVRPSEGADEAIRLLMNTSLTMIAENGGWWLVLAPGEGNTAGWIKKEEVAATAPDEYWSRFSRMATVKVDVAIVRSEGSRLSPPLTTVFLNTRLGVGDVAGDWVQVVLPAGEKGWIYQDLLEIGDAPSGTGFFGTNNSFAFIDNVVAAAQGFLGVPYRWGGRSPQGFDCSGLIYTVFAMNGIVLPRDTWPQYSSTQIVPKETMTRGDLVFFTTYRPGPSHVGLYLGRGRFIHASSRRGVTISRLDDPYYAARFLGARRVLPRGN
ncbi:MAG: C40 family peptidase [Firmicutes bacterium]|nr:C40 family peptidase [Bacillota bacterium]